MAVLETKRRFSKKLKPYFGEDYARLIGPETHLIYEKSYPGSSPTEYHINPNDIEDYLKTVIPPSGYASPEEAIVGLAKHFSREFRWKTGYFGKPSIKEMLEDRKGNCHVKGTLLAASLKALGIPAIVDAAKHKTDHTRVMVQLPEDMHMAIDFDADNMRITTPHFIWTIWDNATTVRDVRRVLKDMPTKKRINVLSTYSKAGKTIPFEELSEKDIKRDIDRVIWRNQP